VPGGRVLFTATAKPAVGNDAMTGLESLSLGAEQYRKLLGAVGISVAKEYEDEGENHYFDAFKGNSVGKSLSRRNKRTPHLHAGRSEAWSETYEIDGSTNLAD